MIEANLSAGGVGGVEEENQAGKTWIGKMVPLLCPSGCSGGSHCTDPLCSSKGQEPPKPRALPVLLVLM